MPDLTFKSWIDSTHRPPLARTLLLLGCVILWQFSWQCCAIEKTRPINYLVDRTTLGHWNLVFLTTATVSFYTWIPLDFIFIFLPSRAWLKWPWLLTNLLLTWFGHHYLCFSSNCLWVMIWKLVFFKPFTESDINNLFVISKKETTNSPIHEFKKNNKKGQRSF